MKWLLIVAAAVLASPAAAQTDKDLDLIPQASAPAQPQASSDPNQRIYLEDALSAFAARGDLAVPAPPPPGPRWQERLLLDLRKEWSLSDRLGFTYSGRLNLRAENDLPVPGHENVVNDLREAYASWQPVERLYLDLGRINLKSGTALGFNPTDYFKTHSVVEPLTSDPTVLREDRLGTLMLRGQRVWEGGSVIVAAAPKIAHQTPIYANGTLPSFDPAFDRTNARDRFLIKANADLAEEFSPEILLYQEGNRLSIGANLTRYVSSSVIGYLEWSGGNRPDLITDALRYGRKVGTIPIAAPNILAGDSSPGFANALAVGLSYTTESKITFNLEYHRNDAGFSGADWRSWFAKGAGAPLPARAELWYIRAYAQDQQVLLGRDYAFLRADWSDAFIRNLELTAFMEMDLRDGSALAQIAADYHLSDRWTIGGLIAANPGGRRSDFGSLPQSATILFKVSRYF